VKIEYQFDEHGKRYAEIYFPDLPTYLPSLFSACGETKVSAPDAFGRVHVQIELYKPIMSSPNKTAIVTGPYVNRPTLVLWTNPMIVLDKAPKHGDKVIMFCLSPWLVEYDLRDLDYQAMIGEMLRNLAASFLSTWHIPPY
jgi:hypothetical protein